MLSCINTGTDQPENLHLGMLLPRSLDNFKFYIRNALVFEAEKVCL